MYAREKFSIASHNPPDPERGHTSYSVRPIHAPPIGPLDCTFHQPGELPAEIRSQWDVLADQASDPNCFAERWFLEPSLALISGEAAPTLAIVTSADGLLVGLMPLAFDPTYGRLPVNNVMNWRHHHSFLGVPLVRRGVERQFWEALLRGLDDGPWPARLLHIADLPLDGRTLMALHEAARNLGRPCDIVLRKHRAMLKSALGPAEYWEQTVRKKKRKEIKRLATRLGEQGDLAFRTLAQDEAAGPWIETFLELESRGWKGRKGTAMACEPNLATFLRTVAAGAHAQGKLDFHRLDLNGQPIAMLINFLTGVGGFSYKIAFDEDYARYSPGILIEQYNLRILDHPHIEWMDSCAVANHSMIESLWTQRREIVRVTVPIGSERSRWVFRASRMAEDTSSRLRKWRSHLGRKING